MSEPSVTWIALMLDIVCLLQDKKYYPTAEEVYGPEVEVRYYWASEHAKV